VEGVDTIQKLQFLMFIFESELLEAGIMKEGFYGGTPKRTITRKGIALTNDATAQKEPPPATDGPY
jgi:hypothetical protein